MTRDPQCRQKWCAMLAKLCAPMDAVEAVSALVAMLPLLADLPDEAFNERSLAHVAGKAKRCPTYADLRLWLDQWWQEHKPAPPALPDNVAAIPAEQRPWLSFWHRRKAENFAPMREPDGRLSRPDLGTDPARHLAHTVSLIRTIAPQAWALIEAEECKEHA